MPQSRGHSVTLKYTLQGCFLNVQSTDKSVAIVYKILKLKWPLSIVSVAREEDVILENVKVSLSPPNADYSHLGNWL
jgi:hypothetical protein